MKDQKQNINRLVEMAALKTANRIPFHRWFLLVSPWAYQKALMVYQWENKPKGDINFWEVIWIKSVWAGVCCWARASLRFLFFKLFMLFMTFMLFLVFVHSTCSCASRFLFQVKISKIHSNGFSLIFRLLEISENWKVIFKGSCPFLSRFLGSRTRVRTQNSSVGVIFDV